MVHRDLLNSAGESTKLTADGQFVGTPAYMPLEQWAGRAEARSDLYALGCLLYEMVTGFLPFQATSWNECYHQHITHTPRVDPETPGEGPGASAADRRRGTRKAGRIG
jgi:serine/threonine-protein kinase